MSKVKSLLYSPEANFTNQRCPPLHKHQQGSVTALKYTQTQKIKFQQRNNQIKNGTIQKRPVSFTADSFDNFNSITTKRESINAQQNYEDKKMQVNLRNVFVSFAIDSQADQEQQLPYFCSLQQSPRVKQNSLPYQDQNKANDDSYKSNFILQTQDYSLKEWSQSMPAKPHIVISPISQMNTNKDNLSENIDTDQKKEQKSTSVHKGKTMESEGLLQIEKNKYKKVSFRISEIAITIQEVPIQIKNISKIKIYPIEDELPKCNTLKLTIKGMGEQLLLGLKRKTIYGEFPLPYYTFVKIVIKKLKSMGINSVTEWQAPQKAPNAFYFKKMIKTEQKSNDTIKNERSLSRDDSHNRKQSIQKRKRTRSNMGSSAPEPKMTKANTFIHGKIYKKSKHWGYWEKRYAIINQLGIYSYREQEDESASIKIQRQNIRYIWTWFSVLVEHKRSTKKGWKSELKQQIQTAEYEQREVRSKLTEDSLSSSSLYLIIKVKHGFSQHTEFAIPICNFDTDSKFKNWLYAFYRVLPFREEKK